jgi:hypothetical protein
LEDKAASVVVANGWIVHEWRKIKKEEKKGWETKSIYLVTLFLHGIESQSQRGNEVCVYIERRVSIDFDQAKNNTKRGISYCPLNIY